MKKKQSESRTPSGELRRRAEDILRAEGRSPSAPADMKHLLHELATHQIELEIQNEDLRRAEEDLELSIRRYADLYNFAPVGYFTFDRDGVIMEVNATGASMLGQSRQILFNKPFMVFLDSSKDRDIFALHRAEVLRSGLKTNCELRVRGRNDVRFHALLESVVSEEPVGRRLIRTIVIDITERREAEERLKTALEELGRSNRELEQFAYIASHDLQEPLRMVSSFLQLLSDRYRGKLDGKADQYIGFAVDGARRMQELIEDLLAYSRIARGREFGIVDMDAAFSQAVTNLSAAISETSADVSGSRLPKVFGDEVQLVQLLQNLIGNALKFRRPDVRPHVTVAAERQGQEWLFSVRDNGIGIDPQYFGKIFQIFQRLHTREEYPGTGIGLSLCRRIVERHHGGIRVESVPGEGSVFYFTIPVGTNGGPDGEKGD